LIADHLKYCPNGMILLFGRYFAFFKKTGINFQKNFVGKEVFCDSFAYLIQ